MSMSTHVAGFVPPDDEWRKKAAAWDACKAAGVEPPQELCDFFGGEDPDPLGREVSQRELGTCVREYRAEGSTGFEIDLAALHRDHPAVKVIRVYNSW